MSSFLQGFVCLIVGHDYKVYEPLNLKFCVFCKAGMLDRYKKPLDYYAGNLEAALYTRVVSIGDHNPPGEANYLGYSRVKVKTIYEDAVFPKSADVKSETIKCVALLRNGFVVSVSSLDFQYEDDNDSRT